MHIEDAAKQFKVHRSTIYRRAKRAKIKIRKGEIDIDALQDASDRKRPRSKWTI